MKVEILYCDFCGGKDKVEILLGDFDICPKCFELMKVKVQEVRDRITAKESKEG